jgi:hypothetical protein
MRPMRPAILLVALLAVLVACTGPSASVSSAEPPSSSASGDPSLVIADAAGAPDGPVLQVADAIAGAHDEPVHVQGGLVVDPDGTVRLCEALAESFPPQCTGARLLVEGLDLDMLGALQEGNGVRWLEGATLFGVVTGS